MTHAPNLDNTGCARPAAETRGPDVDRRGPAPGGSPVPTGDGCRRMFTVQELIADEGEGTSERINEKCHEDIPQCKLQATRRPVPYPNVHRRPELPGRLDQGGKDRYKDN